MRKLTKNKHGVLFSDRAMIFCPLMSHNEEVGCRSQCAFYSKVDENRERHYAYCNLNGSRLPDNEILIGEFPEDNPASEAIADSQ